MAIAREIVTRVCLAYSSCNPGFQGTHVNIRQKRVRGSCVTATAGPGNRIRFLDGRCSPAKCELLLFANSLFPILHVPVASLSSIKVKNSPLVTSGALSSLSFRVTLLLSFSV